MCDFLCWLVRVSYVLMTLAMIHIIVQSFLQKTYGMPPLGTIVMLATTAMCGFIGPWVLGPLFYPSTDKMTVWIWRAWFFMTLIVYVQWIAWGIRTHPDWPFLKRYAVPLSLAAFLVALAGAYTFVVFYQDFYVNELSPIGMLLLAIGYITTVFLRPSLYGLSLAVAWYWFIGNALLYGATMAGGMHAAYPDAEHGYAFVYWVFAITLVLNVAYIIMLTPKRDRLREAPSEPRGA
ncbi:MAG: hypothetical protein PVH91_11135 [Pseudomonadales bacterium]